MKNVGIIVAMTTHFQENPGDFTKLLVNTKSIRKGLI